MARSTKRSLVAFFALVFVAAACSGSATLVPSPSPPADRTSPVQAVRATAQNIQAFWAQRFSELYGGEYLELPLSRLYPAGQSSVSIPPCGGAAVVDRDWQGNAFYCFDGNYIVYDARPDGMIAGLRATYGDPAVGTVFAHEWGHAIQGRTDNVARPSIYKELQADCFSGAWVDATIEDTSDTVDISTDDLDAILGAMLTFRDEPGSNAGAANAHGSGFDRVSAFQDGYENGPEACVPYFKKPPIITEIPFTTRREVRSGGNVAAGKVLVTSVELLNDFYGKVARRAFVPLKMGRVFSYDPADAAADLPTCGGVVVEVVQLTEQVFLCRADRYVVVDGPYVQRIYEEIGDFGVATTLAGSWASYVQGLQGVPGVESEATAVARECYTGGFAAALVNGALESRTLGPVQASGGDLDEAIRAYIFSAGSEGTSGDAVFSRVDAFRDGFLGGYPSCKAHLPPVA